MLFIKLVVAIMLLTLWVNSFNNLGIAYSTDELILLIYALYLAEILNAITMLDIFIVVKVYGIFLCL